jgi:hypothetical protein
MWKIHSDLRMSQNLLNGWVGDVIVMYNCSVKYSLRSVTSWVKKFKTKKSTRYDIAVALVKRWWVGSICVIQSTCRGWWTQEWWGRLRQLLFSVSFFNFSIVQWNKTLNIIHNERKTNWGRRRTEDEFVLLCRFLPRTERVSGLSYSIRFHCDRHSPSTSYSEPICQDTQCQNISLSGSKQQLEEYNQREANLEVFECNKKQWVDRSLGDYPVWKKKKQ